MKKNFKREKHQEASEVSGMWIRIFYAGWFTNFFNYVVLKNKQGYIFKALQIF